MTAEILDKGKDLKDKKNLMKGMGGLMAMKLA